MSIMRHTEPVLLLCPAIKAVRIHGGISYPPLSPTAEALHLSKQHAHTHSFCLSLAREQVQLQRQASSQP